MKTVLKRVIPLFISVLMIVAMLPQLVFADDTEEDAAKDDNLLTFLQVEDLELREGVDAYETSEWDEDENKYVEYLAYDLYGAKSMQITVIYNDKTFSGNVDEVVDFLEDETGEDQYVSFIYKQSLENQWVIGYSYPVTIGIMGKTAEFQVTITDNPLTSIIVKDMDIIEGTCGYYESGWDPETQTDKEYFHYYLYNSNSFYVTIQYDGETFSGDRWDIEEYLREKTGRSVSVSIETDQSYTNQWVAGKSYPATVSVLGKTTEFHVTIKNRPVTSFNINSVEILEGTNGYYSSSWDYETQTNRYYYQYDLYNIDDLLVSIIYNGTEYSGTYSEIAAFLEEQTGISGISFSYNQSYTNQWVAGGTYPVTATLMGLKTEFEVKIKDSLLTSLKVDSIEVSEGTCGGYRDAWDSETQSYVPVYVYDPNSFDPLWVTIEYAGEEYSGTRSEIESILRTQTGEGVSLSFSTVQSYPNMWTAGGTYPVTVWLMGETAEFEVTINESPLTFLEVEGLEIIEGTCCSRYTTWDSATQSYKSYYRYNPGYSNSLRITVECVGETFTGTQSEVTNFIQEKTGKQYTLSFSSDQSYSNQWVAGETYSATATLMGLRTEFDVTIKASPLTSLTVEPLEIIEGTCGYYSSYWDPVTQIEKKYYHYYPGDSNSLRITIKYEGDEFTGTRTEIASFLREKTGTSYWVSLDYEQSYENQWVVGKSYPVTATLMGKSAEFNVTIKKSPLTSLKVTNLEIIEGTCGYLSSDGPGSANQYYYYDMENVDSLRVTIVCNGEEYTGTRYEVANYLEQKTGIYQYVSFSTNQSYSNPWTAGNTYKATATLMGQRTEFDVTIKKSPLTSLTVEKLEIIEGTSGYTTSDWNPETQTATDQYFRYNLNDSRTMQATIVYDGESFTGTPAQIASFFQQRIGESISPSFSTDQSYTNQWTAGNTYKATATLMGLSTEFDVTIKESPLTSIKVTNLEIIEGTCGYETSDGPGGQGTYFYYALGDVSSLRITIVYEGDEYTGTRYEVANYLEQKTGIYQYVSFSTNQSYSNPWTVGHTYKATATLMGQSAEFDVTIKQSPMASIKVDNLEIVEGTCGYQDYDYYDSETGTYVNKYFYYEPQYSNKMTATVVYDGKTYKGTLSNIVSQIRKDYGSDLEISYYIYTNQSYNNQWTAGKTYTATAKMMGKECTFSVTITKSQLTSLKIGDNEIIEGTNGYYTSNQDPVTGAMNSYYYYPIGSSSVSNVQVVYAGESYSGTLNDVLTFLRTKTGANNISFTTDFEQSASKPWVAGKSYPVKITLMGKEVSFKIKIKASELSSFTVDDITILEGSNGYLTYDENGSYYRYNIYDLINITAIYKGKTYKTNYYDISKDLSPVVGTSVSFAYNDTQSASPWLPGKPYEVTAYLLGKSTTFHVTIQKGVTPTGIKPLTSNNITLYSGFAYTKTLLGVTYQPENGKQGTTWKITDSSLMGVSGDTAIPNVYTYKAGTTTATATSIEDPKLTQTFSITILDQEPPAGTYTTTVQAGIMSDPDVNQYPDTMVIDPKTITMKEGEGAYIALNMESATCVPWASYFNQSFGDQLSFVEFISRGGGGNVRSGKATSYFTFILKAKAKGSGTFKIGNVSLNVIVTDGDTKLFTDVQNPNAWYYSYVYKIAGTKNANGEEIMSGFKDGSFGPSKLLTRHDFAVIIRRLADVKEDDIQLPAKSPFDDAIPGKYYYKSVVWANDNGLITGYSNGKFGVGNNITREQIAAILYRYADKYLELDISEAFAKGNLGSFTDGTAVSSWAKDALTWANGAGIITGKSNNTRIDARGNATRAEIATMIIRFIDYMNDTPYRTTDSMH